MKSTVDEIRNRFDNDVERFSDLDTGQQTTIDAALSLELITEAAKRICPKATHLLDIGCGAGNYTIKMLQKINDLNCTLVDLSKPMLDRAHQRVSEKTTGLIEVIQSDIRKASLVEGKYDIILAGAVLHHLRDYEDWNNTFKQLYGLLKPGGCLMISDLVTQDTAEINDLIWDRYGDYLESLRDFEFRRKVMEYVAKEDSPRSLNFQLDLMKQVGFSYVEILHKNICFASFGGIK